MVHIRSVLLFCTYTYDTLTSIYLPSAVRYAADPLAVLPEAPILGLLPLRFPTSLFLFSLHRVDPLELELNICARYASSLHNAGSPLIPDRSEDIETDRGESELVPVALETESVSSRVQLAQLSDI